MLLPYFSVSDWEENPGKILGECILMNRFLRTALKSMLVLKCFSKSLKVCNPTVNVVNDFVTGFNSIKFWSLSTLTAFEAVTLYAHNSLKGSFNVEFRLDSGCFWGWKIIWVSLMAVNSLSQNFVNDPRDNTQQNNLWRF